jgi:hypothetical protein
MLAAIVGSLLVTVAAILGIQLLLGRIDSEAQLRLLLPDGVPVLGTIPPIVSTAERRQKRFAIARTLTVCVAVCVAVFFFLHKVRPTL